MDFLEEDHKGEVLFFFAPYQEVYDISMTKGEVSLDHMGEVALPGSSTVKLLFFPL